MEDFHLLMEDLGKLLDLTIIPDKHNACVLDFNDKISVQIEPDIVGNSIILASTLGEIPAGKFRENVLSQGLKYNASFPREGTFAYFAQNNELVFFHSLLSEGLQAEKVEEVLSTFAERATAWKNSISRGSTPELLLPGEVTNPSIF